jgi:hypothetical protein
MRQVSRQANPIAQTTPPAGGGFWLKALGAVLLAGSVGLVSCQALWSL